MVDVLVDAVSSTRNVTVSGTRLIIPWALAEKHKRRHCFAKGADAYLVDPELLLVYKIGALVGRAHYLDVTTTRKAHYQSKLWKDARDVLGILENCSLDSKKVRGLVESCNLKEIMEPAYSIAFSYLDAGQQKTFQGLWAKLFAGKGKQTKA